MKSRQNRQNVLNLTVVLLRRVRWGKEGFNLIHVILNSVIPWEISLFFYKTKWRKICQTWPLEAARGSSPREESRSSELGWGCVDADAEEEAAVVRWDEWERRVRRKAERAASAREGGNHSRVCNIISGPLVGWSDSARHAIGEKRAEIGRKERSEKGRLDLETRGRKRTGTYVTPV